MTSETNPRVVLPDQLVRDLDAGFAALVDTHGAMVLTLTCRLTDATTGQDLTQEVFLRAYRALRGFTPDRIAALEVRPWLATIARNLVRNEYRRQHRRATVPLADVESARTGDSEPNESDAVLDSIDSQARLDQLLDTLSDAQRDAVVLRHVVGLSMREVAITMACPEGTAKSLVSRGLSRLRQQAEIQGRIQ